MVLGAFAAAGVGKLIRCDESMNAKEYIKILDIGFQPTVQRLMITEIIIFQQDNSPAHTAKVVG